MPEMDGYEATRAIRRHEELRAKNRTTLASFSGASPHSRTRIPIVALTANAMQGDKEKCLQAGMDDYLAKPIRPESLHAILNKWLTATEPEAPTSFHSSTPPLATPFPFDPNMVAQWQALGGPDLFARMVNQFVQDAIACVETLESACASKNPEKLRDAAHGLKGICRNMGANGLAELASTVERECQNHIPANMPQTISSIRTAITHMASNEKRSGR
ncbi:MAG: response regulator [Nitrospira sp.]|nr:response regulator [Nitrospira sp.]